MSASQRQANGDYPPRAEVAGGPTNGRFVEATTEVQTAGLGRMRNVRFLAGAQLPLLAQPGLNRLGAGASASQVPTGPQNGREGRSVELPFECRAEELWGRIPCLTVATKSRYEPGSRCVGKFNIFSGFGLLVANPPSPPNHP
jgi:hypothetical protein